MRDLCRLEVKQPNQRLQRSGARGSMVEWLVS